MKLKLAALAFLTLALPAFAQGSLSTPNYGCGLKVNGTAVGCPFGIAVGGTGGATAAAARTSLGVTATGADTTYAFRSNNLSDLASAGTARTNLGLGGASTLDVGTTTGTVAAGDDSRITGAAQKASNLSDLANAATARTNLGLGSLAILNTINNSNWSGTALAVANGGTGATAAGATAAGNIGALAVANNLSDVTASTARTNLGLGALATLASVNNSNWSGTALAIGNGGTGQTTALAARGSAGLNIESGTGHGDSAYTILATDRYVYTNAAFTASRTWTLPAANSVNPGQSLVIDDAQGTLTAANTLVVTRAGTDTVNGGTSFTLDVAYGRLILKSDGVSKWTLRAQRPYGTSAGNAITLDSSAKLPAVDGSALTALNGANITSGPVGVAVGGTGATSAAGARSSLGAAASGANTDITSLSSPALASATATTQSSGDNTTKVATTAFVQAQKRQLITGNSGSTSFAAGTTNYFSAGAAGASVTNAAALTGGLTGTLKNLYIQTPAIPGASQSYTFTLETETSDTAITCAISGAASASCNDTTHTVSVAGNERWSIKIVTTAGAASVANVAFALEFDPS